jgi:hypothetical protein
MSGDHNQYQKDKSYLDFECPRCGHCCTDDYETAPPKREWIGLTKEEIAQGPQEVLPVLYGRWGWAEKEAFEAVVAWAEAKLKEKNT